MTYRICFVCLGNICRSPIAEVVMRSALRDAGLDDAVEVSSAGTGDWHIGERADARTLSVLERHGYDLATKARLSFPQASLVYFQGVDGLHLGWNTTIYGTDSTAYQTVVDASSGQVLYRRSLVNYANGLVWDNYPGATTGGTQRTVDLSSWLTPGATTLTGPNAHVYSDLNDNNKSDAGEEQGTIDVHTALSDVASLPPVQRPAAEELVLRQRTVPEARELLRGLAEPNHRAPAPPKERQP